MMVEDWRQRLLTACDAANAAGMSDYTIAKNAGLGRNFVQQLRTTTREPAVKHVIRLADALGVSLTYLFVGDEFTAQDEEFFQLLRHSTPEGRELAAQILKSVRSAK